MTYITCWKKESVCVRACVCVCVHVRTRHGWATGTCGAGFQHISWDNTDLVFPSRLSILNVSLSSFSFFFLASFLFFYPLFSFSLSVSYACSHSHKPSKLADTKADGSITDLNRIYLNFSWPHIDLYITQIFLRSKVRLQRRGVVSDKGTDERAEDLKRDEKGESSRMKLRERSMGRFWQRDDRVAR